jgi:hypothetical protein
MRHPHTPYQYPREGDFPPGPAWTALWNGPSVPISETTTEVPVIGPSTGLGADTSAAGERTEVVREMEQFRVDGHVLVEEPVRMDEPVRRDEPIRMDEPAPAAPAAGLRPGDVTQSPIAVWPGDHAQEIRDRWRDLQVLFIDEPDEAVAGARSLVTEAVRILTERLLAEQEEFDPARDNEHPDTETLRVAMRRYREFLNRVLAL